VNRLQAVIAAGALSALALGACAFLLTDAPSSPFGATDGASRVVTDSRPVVELGPARGGVAAPLSSEQLVAQTEAAEAATAARRTRGQVQGTVVRQASGRAPVGHPPARRQAASMDDVAAPSSERIQTRIQGRVVDDRGAPLADVQVASLGTGARGSTNAHGEFELLLDRAAGAEHAGLVLQARAAGFETAQRVLVSQEPELELTLTLEPRYEESALTVYLLDSYGERVPQERVHVTPEGSVDTFSSPTLDDGSCRVTALSPGPVLVWVRRASGGEPTLQQRVELLPGENELDLRLPR
jgi:hypothetical protein